MAFDVGRVRAAARERGWEEVAYNTASRVLGFRRGAERVNVYYTTGTVGTCVNHPRRGRSQLFRRSQSWASLMDILEDPRTHTGAGYYRKHSAGRPEPSFAGGAPTGLWAQVGDCTDEVVNGVTPADTAVLALSTTGGYFVLETDGHVWWSDVPRFLYNKLWGRQASLPSVDYVAMGGDYNDTYFVQFTDGKKEWMNVPASLNTALYDTDDDVELMAFAPDDGFFVLWADGSTQWESLPIGLHNMLSGRAKRSLAGVETIACGPDNEWFVRFLDGAWRAGGLPSEASRRLGRLQAKGHDIMGMSFGGYNHWAILYA